MYVISGCKGRGLRLQGDVIHVTFVLQRSFFCLETKERTKEKFKAYFFLLLASCTTLKGRNSLRSNSLPFLTLRCGRSLDGEKSRPGDRAGGVEQWEEVRGEVMCEVACEGCGRWCVRGVGVLGSIREKRLFPVCFFRMKNESEWKMNQTVVSLLGVTKKSILSLFSSFGKEEWSQTEVVGKIMFIPIFL